MNLLLLFVGVPGLISGVRMLLFPHQRRLKAEGRVAHRKAQLASGEAERFFEERRTLDVYPLPSTGAKWRMRGALLTACGIALLVLAFVR
jgi:hypothetical protein